MKPSERIEKIVKLCAEQQPGHPMFSYEIGAIIAYLDEQWQLEEEKKHLQDILK